MNNTHRRDFIRQTTILGLASLLPIPSYSGVKERLFKVSLNPGAIGVTLNQQQLLDAAIQYQFEAIVPLLTDLEQTDASTRKALMAKMQQHNITWDATNLPVEFRKDQATFQQGLTQLKKYGAVMQELNIQSCSTWIMPTHESLTYLENFKQHSSRLKETAKILADYGLKLGLEYVGPKTLMSLKKHPFISSMKETRELISATQSNNIGIQLDSFHWYCAEETTNDILSLNPDEIITCDLNDAVKGRSIEEQIDYERELPGISGVIDLKSFLNVLVEIGYSGAIRAEPFSAKLNNMNNESALALTKKQMDWSMALIN